MIIAPLLFYYLSKGGFIFEAVKENNNIGVKKSEENYLEKKEDHNINIDIPNPKNIILITIESARYDHFGFMGYPRETTPFLSELSKRALIFENMITPIPITFPSHASIFSGLYPQVTEIRINNDKLDDEVFSLAEYLKEKDYKTGAFVSASSISFHNLDQGFDTYEIVKMNEEERPENPRVGHRSAEETMALAYEWLDEQEEDDRVFLWVHLDEPHMLWMDIVPEYVETREDVNISDDDLYKYLVEDQYITDIENAVRIGYPEELMGTKTDQDLMIMGINRYDGAIQKVDSVIENLYKYFENREMIDESLWFVLADHGEGIGTHNYRGHSDKIYQEQIRTPLIIHSPSMNEGYRLSYLSENVDILPTISEIVGFNLNKGYKINGKSLLSYIKDKKGREFVYSITPTNKAYSIQNEKYKYIYHDKEIIKYGKVVNEDMFFDLENDPYEQNNLLGTMPEVEEEMKNEILRRVVSYEKN